MHTLPARDTPVTHLNAQLPHLLLHYDSCSGEVSFISTDPSSRPEVDVAAEEASDMREAAEPPPTIRRHANPQQLGRRPSVDVGISKTSPKRQSSKFGSMMRKLIRRGDRHHASLPNEVFAPPSSSNYPGGYPPKRKSYGNRPVSAAESKELPQSPLTAHPMAVADSDDAVARITKFVTQKSEVPRGSSMPNCIFSTPMAGQTWYDNREISTSSEHEEQRESNGTSARSLASSRHRSRSVSALSDSTRPSERHVLRKQKSMKSLRRSLSRRRNTTPDDVPTVPAYPSGLSETISEPVLSELPADIPDIPNLPQPLPSLMPVQRPKTAGHQLDEPRQTFDFSSLANAMRNEDEINLQTHEERLTAMEVKMMSLEYAISKVQGRLPADRPVSYRKPSTQDSEAKEGAYAPSQSAAPPPLLKRSKSPPATLKRDTLPSGSLHQDQNRSQSLSSSTSTIRPSRPAPAPPVVAPTTTSTTLPPPRPSRPPPPPADQRPITPMNESRSPQVIVETNDAPNSPRRASITLMTVDHYSKLVSLLRHEQAARKQLADEVTTLQQEILALRPLAHSPLGTSYRSWRDAKSQTIEKGWAVVEEFRAGRPVGRSQPGSPVRDTTRESGSTSASHGQTAPADTPGRRSVDDMQVPPSPMASDTSEVSEASSDASFGAPFATPLAEISRNEHNLFFAGVPAGQAF